MTQPKFAVVSAVYNVARFLPEYFSSLEAQTYPHSRIRVILVDDGSTDGSGESCESWADTTDIDVSVIHQNNAGQASARNVGIDALGDEDWVTFTDPDDFLDPEFFSRISDYLNRNDCPHLVAAHHLDYWEEDPERPDRHPLRFRFASGDRTVDLDRFPRNFHMHVASSCLQVAVLLRSKIRFDERVRPVFEDAHLIAKYMLESPVPTVAFIDSAKYFYRRRGDGSSTMQNAKEDPRRYTDVLEYGTLELLRYAYEKRGALPQWVEYLVVYDLTWIYRSEDALHGTFKYLSRDVCEKFHELAGQSLLMLDPLSIEGYPDVSRSTAQREAMVYGYRSEPWHWEEIVVNGLDADQGLVKLVYHYTGKPPTEQVRVAGLPVEPRYAKVRDFVYLGRALVHERIIWVPSNGTLQVSLNGRRIPISPTWPKVKTGAVRPAEVYRMRQHDVRRAAITLSNHKTPRKRRLIQKRRPKYSAEKKRVLRAERLARHEKYARLFGDAWVLMDRSHSANDNAEHLFRYLRKHRPDINAWFVVEENSPDWRRLREEGLDRIVGYGTMDWMVLCLRASHMISSHVDQYVQAPFERPGGWRWRSVFLQHGVTQVDLSRWLNPKRIDLFITASKDEYASIAGDGSGYAFTTREVKRTGFPRHDRLLELAAKRALDDKAPDYILVMPTWRAYLPKVGASGVPDREQRAEFTASSFARHWGALLRDERLHHLARRGGYEIVFMPHPNLEPYLRDFNVPRGVRMATYKDNNVQEMVSRASVMVTDYSSIAFDAAIIDIPIVYFQFDRREFLGGGHTGRPGYFDYHTHGFGPVAESVRGAAAEIDRVVASGFKENSTFGERRSRAFGRVRPGASARVVQAIEDLSRPLSRRQLATPILAPQAPPLAVEQVIELARSQDSEDLAS